ncbi:MAG: DUF4178 domain-containing protein, partial [Bacteroidota bacterium]
MASDSNYTRLTIRDLKDGCFLEYDLKTWKVTAENVYEWDDGRKSKEFKIVAQGRVRFLEIEDFDELKLFISERISMSKIQENVTRSIADTSVPPEQITFGGQKYTREGEHAGRYKELGSG